MADFVTAMKTKDVPPGMVKAVKIGGRSVVVCNVDGEYYAVDDICTHDGGPLGSGKLCDAQIECPRHGARFDVRSGRAVVLPAILPIGTHAVEVDGDDVKVSLEDNGGRDA
jgi:3-phenylpropionate/trans-cinnamate dioxygenase ferredoxin component